MARCGKLTDQCAKCGACAQVCPVFIETGRESHCARGKLHLAAKGVDYTSQSLNHILSHCIQCGACDQSCPRDLEPSRIIRDLRSKQSTAQTDGGYRSLITRTVLQNPTLLRAAGSSLALLQKLPKASGLRHKLGKLPLHHNLSLPQPIAGADKPLLYYPGCLASHVQTDISQATHYLASLCGYRLIIPPKTTCCGISSATSGKESEAQNQALRTIKAYADSMGPILTSCGSCYAQLQRYPELFEPGTIQHRNALHFAERVQEFSTFFLHEETLCSPAPAERVYYHDPCHLRFGPVHIMDAPRQLIWNLNGQPVVNGEQPLGCCGQGGLFALVHPTLAESIFSHVKKQITATPQTYVVTTCSSCLMGLQQHTANTAITSQHLSVFLAKRCTSC